MLKIGDIVTVKETADWYEGYNKRKEIATQFRLTLVNHLSELKVSRECHVQMGNIKGIKSYDIMIKNISKNIDKMDRIINDDISPSKDIKEHKLK